MENKILDSTKYVVDNADSVKINKAKVDDFAKGFEKHKEHYWLADSPFDIDSLNEKQKIMFIAVFNSLSFSYWGDPYWNVEYKGKKHTRGSWSLVACIFRAIEEGRSLLDPEYLSNISKEELNLILRGNTEIPLLEERASILNELGKVLIEKYNGSLTEVLKKAEGDAQKLLDIILESFPSFQDSENYKSKQIFFQKRAQAMVEGIYSIFKGKGYGELKNINSLTALADYIIPNLLREIGIFEYSDELTEKIDNNVMLEKGSAEEIEIRASTIWAIELIRKKLESEGTEVSALNINDYLWTIGGKVKTPFHRTRTTSY